MRMKSWLLKCEIFYARDMSEMIQDPKPDASNPATENPRPAMRSAAEALLSVLPETVVETLPIPRVAHEYVRRRIFSTDVDLSDPEAVAAAIPAAVRDYLVHLVHSGEKAELMESDIVGLLKHASHYISYKEGEGSSCRCCGGWLEGVAGHRADCLVGYVQRVFGGASFKVAEVVIAPPAQDTALTVLAELRQLIDTGDGNGMPVFTDKAAVFLVLGKMDRMLSGTDFHSHGQNQA